MIALLRRSWRRARRGDSESGFTLIEVVIAVVLLSMIMGAISAAFVTSMKLSVSTTQHTRNSNDAQLIAAFLVRDAQAAGATDPISGAVDPGYGVALNDATGCAVPAGTSPVVRFEWRDRQSVPTTHDNISVYYFTPPTGALQGQSGHLARQICVDGTTSRIELARNIPHPPTATCDPAAACTGPTPGLPNTVSLTMIEAPAPGQLTPSQPYTLTATTRPQVQPVAPPNATGSPTPLALLGGGACNGGAPLAGNSNVPVTVYGTTFIEGGSSNCAAYNLDDYTSTGGTDAVAPAQCSGAAGCTDIAGITKRDPYDTLAAPPAAGPSRSGCSGPGVYNSGFSLAAGATCNLPSGIYYVRNGFSVGTGATLTTDPDVLIYLESGQFTITGKFIAQPYTQAPYAGIALWQAKGDAQPLTTLTGSNVHVQGIVYAPDAAFNVAKGIALKGLVAQGLSYGPTNGVGVSQIGMVTPAETSVSQSVVDQGTNETITINGSNFLGGPNAKVEFSNSGVHVNSFSFDSSTQITVAITLADDATLGASNFTITNGDGGIDIEEGAFTVEPRPVITSVTLANGTPPNNGLIQAGDTITVVFSKPMRETSFCPAWTGGDAADQVLNTDGDVTVTAADGGPTGNDTISITSAAVCDPGPPGNPPASFGTIDLGAPDYVAATETFAGAGAGASTITWTAPNTLTITLGTQNPAPVVPAPPAAAPSAPTYTVPARIVDTRGGSVVPVTPPTYTTPPPNALQF